MTKQKTKSVIPEVLELLKKELDEIQNDLLKKCGADSFIDYLHMPDEQQQVSMYIMVNSKDSVITKLRDREGWMIRAILLLGGDASRLEFLLNDALTN